MNCETTRQYLGAYFDGEVPLQVRREVEAHLAACPGCTHELASIRDLATRLAPAGPVVVPEGLWSAIERRLDGPAETVPARPGRFVLLRRYALAASVLVAVGLGAWALLSFGDGASVSRASTVDFSMLLDALPNDAVTAFEKFLSHYHARQVQPVEAKRTASQLDFDIPESLPGGFRLESAYTLRFGNESGAAAMYVRNGEFLGAIFHRPVHREEFGTHKDYECVIGKHRGHAVVVGEWKLVHVTDETTCHCVLSKLNENSELPAVLMAVAPRAGSAPSFPQVEGDHGR
ncbi:MAG TPA: zf-HC2 domain-containing protein [Phycisphaerae bacterium]|nr:zf-HC2 domain-containing protein [Phycisphaerae bacterium]